MTYDNDPGDSPDRPQNRELEERDLLFDFSRIETQGYELVLVAGTSRMPLAPTTQDTLESLRRKHPILAHLPDANATHWVRAKLPAKGLQYCYVQRVHPEGQSQPGTCGDCAAPGRSWDLVLQTMHVPSADLRAAWDRVLGRLEEGASPPVQGKWQRYGVTSNQLAAFDDPVGVEILRDGNDTASTMLSLHPEMISGDPTSYAYVQSQIIGPQPQTAQLAQLIESQGPVAPQANWSGCGSPIIQNPAGYGTNVPLCNPDTGMQAVNSSGLLQYIPVYSTDTNEAAQAAITPGLQSVKADPTLGVNDTQQPMEADGVIYRYADGVPTSDQTGDGLGAGTGFSYTTNDYSPGQGYSIKVVSVAENPPGSDVTAVVSVLVSNWYVRSLGLYVRYLDGDGNVLSTDEVESAMGSAVQDNFPVQAAVGGLWNTADDYFLNVLAPEKEFLGIPTGTPQVTLDIPVPYTAVAFELLASGMGTRRQAQIPTMVRYHRARP